MALLVTISSQLRVNALLMLVDVTCKVSDKEFKKHSLGISDNVTYFSEQLNSTPASTYRYKVDFKPNKTADLVTFTICDTNNTAAPRQVLVSKLGQISIQLGGSC